MNQAKSWKEHQGEVVDSVNGFDVIECQTCGFKHIIPIPEAEELEDIYKVEYYSVEKPEYFERQLEDITWWNMVYAERYEFFEQHLPPTRRRILDVGCGPGFFLKLGKERGWETVGIEPSQQAAEHARGLGVEIINKFFSEDSSDGLGTFDVVYMHEMLEHVSDPALMLRLAYRLLNPTGLLCVIVPNDYNPLQKVLREHLGYEPWWVAPPHHINYFDFDSVERLVQRTGFEGIHKRATFPMELFLLMGDNYVGDDSLGRACHGRRKRLELNLKLGKLDKLKSTLYTHLAGCGVGREIVMLAKRT